MPKPFFIIGARLEALTTRIVLLFLVARLLGDTAQGIFSHATTIAALFAFVFGAGLELSNSYHVARDHALYLVPCACGTLLLMGGGILVSAATVWPLGLWAIDYFDGYPELYFPLIPCLAGFHVLVLGQGGILLGLRRYAAYFWCTLPQLVIGIGGTLAAVLTGRFNLETAMALWLASLVATASVQSSVLLSAIRARRGLRLGRLRRLVPIQLGYAFRASAGALAQALTFRLDALILRAFAPFSVVGTYAVAAAIAEAILLLPRGVATWLLPTLSAARTKPTAAIWRRYALALAAGMAAVAAAVGFAARWVPVLLARPEYAPSVGYARILLIGTALMGWGMLVASHINALNRPGVVSRASILALGVTVAGDLLLIPRFQAWGAAWVSVVAYGLFACVLVVWLARRTAISQPRVA